MTEYRTNAVFYSAQMQYFSCSSEQYQSFWSFIAVKRNNSDKENLPAHEGSNCFELNAPQKQKNPAEAGVLNSYPNKFIRRLC